MAALTDNDVIEVIFKCKLCSLGSYKEDWPVGAPSIDRKEKSIIKFFVDLRELIMEQPSTGE